MLAPEPEVRGGVTAEADGTDAADPSESVLLDERLCSSVSLMSGSRRRPLPEVDGVGSPVPALLGPPSEVEGVGGPPAGALLALLFLKRSLSSSMAFCLA